MSDLQHIISQLKGLLGNDAVRLSQEERYRASMDNARLSFMPDAVLKPQNDEQVSEILKLANKEGIAVTTRGAGTATTGATSPVHAGWVLDLLHWKKLHIDTQQGFAFVEAGVTSKQINDASEAAGWFYPPDPSSQKYSTIGGNLATNAGGLRGAKYGVTRDYVLSLEGLMPSGDFVCWGAPLKKFASGYNLRDLWIGSEGTLGVIVRAVLKLIPKPETRNTYLVGFSNETEALNAVERILEARVMPAIMEFLDCQTVACTLKAMRGQNRGQLGNSELKAIVAGFSSTPSLLLVELDGDAHAVEQAGQKLRGAIGQDHKNWKQAGLGEDAEKLWAVRRSCSQAMFQMGDTKLNEDVVVPLKHYQDLIQYTLDLKQEIQLATPTFGHVADGNFHVHIMYNHDDLEQCKRAKKGLRLLMQKIVQFNGAITGEHGIGLAKSPFLRLQHSPAEIKVMQDIKKLFDPNNILNPGKIFEPFEMWQHQRDYDIVFPWDHGRK